ncbi:heme ABC transporter ATP-binding protein [Pseudonocardiaceae bacterium YIM PH 21723]|nr:heme ABC transporter ATP-binding protein [Pseudonocardiaceae bacterium YIM PH 21723]
MKLSLHRASVRRGTREVVSEVDLFAQPGEVMALVGPNGAGKSSALGAMCGDFELSGGSVLLGDRELRSYSLKELARLRSMLPQDSSLAFPFTVREVVWMGRAPWRGVSTADEDEQAVASALAELGLEPFADRPFQRLSGGERARVSLARVLAQQTPVVLLDEPTAALDLRYQEQVLRTAATLARAGRTVVVVLHDLSLAAAYADRIAVLAKGRLIACDEPKLVLTADLVGEVYGQPVDVLEHPRTGRPLVVPIR